MGEAGGRLGAERRGRGLVWGVEWGEGSGEWGGGRERAEGPLDPWAQPAPGRPVGLQIRWGPHQAPLANSPFYYTCC